VTWLVVMVLEISVAMAVGFILGRIWRIGRDSEQKRAADFTPPPVVRIPHPANQVEPHDVKLNWAPYD
jgi:hypothetical protein